MPYGTLQEGDRMSDDTVGDKPPVSSLEKKKNGCTNGYTDLYELINKHRTERVALFTHRNPDPDAIASMMGLQWMLQKYFDMPADLYYEGEVSHPQNGVMVNLLDPGLKRIDEYNGNNYGMRIVSDTIPENAGVGKHDVKFDACIDHHRDLPQNFSGVLVHKKCGSASSIVFDIIKHFITEDDWFDGDVDYDVKVATALISGIVTDTEYMMSDDSTELEFKAFMELFPFRNSNFLKQIVFFKRPKFWIDTKATGCSKAHINNEGYAVVGLGIIPESQRDLIADMAEEMISWASVDTAVAFAVVGGDKIEGSVRSLNPSLGVSDFSKRLGGKCGTGGGKLGKGAYRLPLAGFSIDQDEDDQDVKEAWDSIETRETKRILRMLKK